MSPVTLTSLLRRLPDDLWLAEGARETAAARRGRDREAVVGGLCHDSRAVRPGDLYFALPGRRVDGSAFVAEAWKRGAAAVVVEGDAPAQEGPGPLLRARSARRSMALLAALFHGEPSRQLRLTGITGTDGKTSTAWFLQQILASAGRRSAALGTLGIVNEQGDLEPWDGGGAGKGESRAAEPARLWRPTTPEAPLFQETLARLAACGVEDVVAEVSSHALDQERIFGSQFAAVGLTHVSGDHLDFHGDPASYRAAKAKLFARDTRGGPLETSPVAAVLNLDDDLGAQLAARQPSERLVTFGRSPRASIRLLRGSAGPDGIVLELAYGAGASLGHEAGASPGHGRDSSRLEMRTPVTGGFHLENLNAAAALAHALGIAPDEVAQALAHLRPVPGRFEMIRAGQPFAVIVDYAHTADGLRRLLEGVRGLGVGRIVLVFGCGGDRDREKRGPMGAVAGRLADEVLITSDNPRSENPAGIAASIAEGVAQTGVRGEIDLDRRSALRKGLARARPGDALVAAGKGAETVQVFADRVVPFDDRVVLREILAEQSRSS